MLGLLLLPAIDNRLAEQAVLVTNTVAMAGDAQRGHALHEARRQTAETTVTQGRVGLQQADALKVHAQFRQRFASGVQQAEVAQAVVEQATNQKFQREVIDALLALAVDLPRVVHPVFDHVVAGGKGYGFEPIVIKRMIGVLADGISEFGQHGVAKCRNLSFANKWFLSH